MRKIFSFKGISWNGDDMLSSEGECLDVVNMRMKDGAFVPLPEPGNVAVLDKLEKIRGFVKTDESKELAEDARIELSQATEVVTSYSKMLKSIKETFESIINMDSNTNINRLTMWNIILVVPTVIVGYYGMNLRLPFAEHSETAVAIFIFIMVLLLGFALFSTLRRRIS